MSNLFKKYLFYLLILKTQKLLKLAQLNLIQSFQLMKQLIIQSGFKY